MAVDGIGACCFGKSGFQADGSGYKTAFRNLAHLAHNSLIYIRGLYTGTLHGLFYNHGAHINGGNILEASAERAGSRTPLTITTSFKFSISVSSSFYIIKESYRRPR